ncbi:ABC transporter permease [Dactylosporangium sp. CA-233914]|uniref:ABC transporter permease n=1 Tax=Dactylosporangium sp. CA-233914 TaxID=3239934 RepID=UPI003D8A12B1
MKAFLSRQPKLLLGGLLLLAPFVLMAIAPSLFVSHGPAEIIDVPLLPPSTSHPFGTDEIGRDVLTRVVYGARVDIVISLSAAAIAFAVGTLFGLLTGFLGGFADSLGMRSVDVLLSFPTIVLALFLITVFGRGELVQILAIAMVMAPSMARFSRGTGLVLRNRGYVEASRISGGGIGHILRRHLLPNALPTLLVAASVLASSAVLIAASLSYLGVGTQPPTPSWGNMLRSAYDVVYYAPFYGLFPGIFVTLVAGAYVMIGEGLRRRIASGRALAAGNSPVVRV